MIELLTRPPQAPPGAPAAAVEAPLAARIAAEYREMPGLCLTDTQACRFWAVDRQTCRAALDALVATGVLRRGADGRYRCAGDLLCTWRRSRAAE